MHIEIRCFSLIFKISQELASIFKVTIFIYSIYPRKIKNNSS